MYSKGLRSGACDYRIILTSDTVCDTGVKTRIGFGAGRTSA
ncbi:hypothetical protein SFHH103_02689 [Sinorhizobium fredii HH103]|uniref:Uncharacterized protein n=1 Tax=Sinorhizobium fredii (strain HH103) TaxID=1117943 RepID=G9AB93_SINF1|nr:hypothetical protein SFHH103_02689 [Sinorhizobium fredii HH103]